MWPKSRLPEAGFVPACAPAPRGGARRAPSRRSGSGPAPRRARGALGLGFLLAVLPGCPRLDMHDQPRQEPFESSRFFADSTSARLPVAGTVARGQLQEDRAFATGMVNDSTYASELPYALTLELLQRGRQRYGIFCSVCHDAAGTGRGMVVRRGFKQPPSLHSERLRGEPVGYVFDVITRGFATMPGYAAAIPPADRWAVAAYVRALQLSQAAVADELPAPLRAELERAVARGRTPAPGREGGVRHD